MPPSLPQVLSKLGPDTLIKDLLGELVKLGTKAPGETGETPASGGSTSSSSSSTPAISSATSGYSSSSCGCSEGSLGSLGSLDGPLRSDSPGLGDGALLGDQDNLRPIVVDGSNVAMR